MLHQTHHEIFEVQQVLNMSVLKLLCSCHQPSLQIFNANNAPRAEVLPPYKFQEEELQSTEPMSVVYLIILEIVKLNQLANAKNATI